MDGRAELTHHLAHHVRMRGEVPNCRTVKAAQLQKDLQAVAVRAEQHYSTVFGMPFQIRYVGRERPDGTYEPNPAFWDEEPTMRAIVGYSYAVEGEHVAYRDVAVQHGANTSRHGATLNGMARTDRSEGSG